MIAKTTSNTQDTDLSAARQKGRGRTAVTPTQYNKRAWKEIIGRVFASIRRDRIMLVAAGVTFYLLLALVPALSAFLAIYGLTADQSTVFDHLHLLRGLIPSGGLEIIGEQLRRLVTEGRTTLSWTLFFSVAIALWSASAGIKAIFEAMNIAYHESEDRGFFKLSALGLAFTLSIAVGATVAIGAVVVIPALFAVLPFGEALGWVVQILSYVILAGLMLLGITALYRFGPSRSRAKWRWISPGAGFAVGLIIIASILFSWYIANFGNYNASYGSLGALVGSLTWVWISVSLLILGAEINSEIEHQTAQDTTTGPNAPLGTRDAYVADTIGQVKG
ncbi:membrane protein [Pelagibacterium luteolum]|uniref:Membrane protein n=1 Tax=Pelagibacterium luteolum TaxID=440168 RepID=A0A1G8ASA9_9HYPH|nr:membrane protein [Pelagibacterium luteolum]